MTEPQHAPPSLSLRDVALFFDVDGTLVPIEEQPEAVKVSDRLRDLVERLTIETDGAFALVSGRSIDQLDYLFRPLAFSASGLHGLEKRLLPGGISRAGESSSVMEAARHTLQSFAADHEGVIFEDKGLTLALHYRMAAEHRDAAAAVVEKLVDADPDHLVLLAGKMVFELKPPGFDKGGAITDFMKEPPFQGRIPIFAGDDVTDEAGFTTINALNGIAIKVGVDGRSTEAGFGVSGVDAMLDWLETLCSGSGEGT